MNLIKEYTKCDCGYKKLVNENGNTLLFGDNYHDKIGYQIEGYLQALENNDINFNLKEVEIICPYCGDETYDEEDEE